MTACKIDWDAAPQREQLTRVSGRIAEAIIAFCREHIEFHAEELRASVRAACGEVAPGSCDRVLRDLRKRGRLNYMVVSRAASRYRVMD